jgi:nitroimidazol reductase NimA-like FMN-containing flavoprotein (pyridoxamine 5'-phosphate oxidase superfamily)
MTTQELNQDECAELLSSGGVGRVAVCTDSGPRIYPVNFTVDGTAIVFRTAIYSELGSALVKGPALAFETDHVDHEHQRGWSVVAQGVAEPIDDPDEIQAIHSTARPAPWASGSRNLYVRLHWRRLEGRRVGHW